MINMALLRIFWDYLIPGALEEVAKTSDQYWHDNSSSLC